jgi:hypothetical protein
MRIELSLTEADSGSSSSSTNGGGTPSAEFKSLGSVKETVVSCAVLHIASTTLHDRGMFRQGHAKPALPPF